MEDDHDERADAREYERLALSMRAIGGGVWDYDIDADTLYCNQRWYEILGLDPLVSPIASIEEFKPHIHPDDVAIATAIDPAVISDLVEKNESYRIEFRIVRPNGEIRWIRSVACVIIDQKTHHRRAIGCVTESELKTAKGDSFRETFAAELTDVDRSSATQRERLSLEPNLTLKERECLMWVSAGKTAAETAVIIGRSARTVEFHLKNAIRKLNAKNKVHAAAIAIRTNLL